MPYNYPYFIRSPEWRENLWSQESSVEAPNLSAAILLIEEEMAGAGTVTPLRFMVLTAPLPGHVDMNEFDYTEAKAKAAWARLVEKGEVKAEEDEETPTS